MAFDWGSAIGAAVSLYGASKDRKAAQQVGKDASQAGAQSNALQERMYNEQVARQEPFYQTGVAANARYAQLLGLGNVGQPQAQYVQRGQDGTPIANAQLYQSDPNYKKAWDSALAEHQGQWKQGYWSGSDPGWIQGRIAAAMPQQPQQSAQDLQQQAFADFRAAPGYQFGLDEGNKAVQASAAARGGLNSGATLKALTRYGQGYADQQGYTPYMNRLSGLFGGAQTAANQIGNAGQNAANQIGNNLQNTAQQRASSTYAANQATQQGLQSLAYYGNKFGTNQGWWN